MARKAAPTAQPRPGAAASDQTASERPRRADALRNEEAIVEAAISVLAERPGASMGEIAEAGGLARATLYRHFASRDELVQAIQARAVAAGARALAGADLREGSAAAALRRAIGALIGVGDRYRLLAREAAIDPAALQGQPAVAGELLAVVRRGQRAGELRRDLPPGWILSSLAGLLVLALREMADESVTAEQAAERVASTLLDGIAAPGRAGA